ncbi:LLM class flavin-dependent oxidoreductase [Mycobacterium sp. UM_CSW]|uniref:LLM class flavin-dependent oxidoreductase n=1 Tax=Mycobacterium sp. UM_CSW TaxID=1370119 RepID=UPI0009DBE779|nr:LLM class flavin-dependent oxidoreductase [Mycobacterium sp. UM_CSW]
MSHPRITIRTPRDPGEINAASLRRWLADVEATAIDGVFSGDHVSFHDGRGFDGLIHAAALAAASERLTVWTAVYLLALRHPVPVARQVASLSAVATGRFVFGVGLGGEDPHELEICGVNPRRRGRQLDAHLEVVRALLAGDEVSAYNEFLSIPGAVIRPVPQPAVPVLIGGRSEAALERAGRAGDGWIAIWITPERAQAALATIAEHAGRHGREHEARRNALMVWCGMADSVDRARSLVGPVMEGIYKTPFSRFERYTPCGTPAQIAEALVPYAELGFTDILLNGVAEDSTSLIAHSDEVAQRLATMCGSARLVDAD